jgi:hypothetical protein
MDGRLTLGTRCRSTLTRIAVLALVPAVLAMGGNRRPTAVTRPGASVRWTQRTPATSPPKREEAAMAFDAASGKTVLFGGFASSTSTLGDTWTWDGATWTQQHPATSPPPRLDAAMATDPKTGHVLLFGGSNSDGLELGDTWTWDGTTWTELHPANSPGPRAEAAAAADTATGNVVLFGGRADDPPGSRFLGDTWTWDGVTWTQQQPAASPSPRGFAIAATDPGTREVVLYGGIGLQVHGDTWTWDGTTWTEQHPAETPGVLLGAAIATDPARRRVVLFGGNNITAFVNGTWIWTDGTWRRRRVPASPPARVSAVMASDPDGRVVLFGGSVDGPSNDTWSLTPSLTIAPTAGPRHTRVVVTGFGFTPGATATVRYLSRAGRTSQAPLRLICSVVVAIDTSFTCPGTLHEASNRGARGPHEIRAEDSSGLKGTTVFTLTSSRRPWGG